MINIKDYINPRVYKKHYRFRIERMRVFPLDENKKVISNSDGDGFYGFSFDIRYPLTFKDIDSNSNTHYFSAQNSHCTSFYINQAQWHEVACI